MEIIGKFLFLILFSVSIGAGAVYVVGPNFFSTNLDNNIFDSDRSDKVETSKVNIKEYRKRLSAEYDAYNEKNNNTKKNIKNENDPIWQDTVDYRR